MPRLILTIIFFAILTPGVVSAQADVDDGYPQLQDMFISQSFLILKTTTDYVEAKEYALNAQRLLNVGADDRGYVPHDSIGLTMSESECIDWWDEYPCYLARGREPSDSLWVSVDFSSAYEGFAEGYYIVILAHGNPDSPDIKVALDRARAVFPDAYLKRTKVYIGCMH